MPDLAIDFETRSLTDLRRSGVYRYAEDPSTAVVCMAYAFGDEAPQVWTPGAPFPEQVIQHVGDHHPLRAFNAQFERVIWRDVLTRQVPDLPVPTLAQWYCTAAETAAMALPRSLGQAAKVLGVAEKDDAGRRLMLQMCRPRRIDDDGTVHWWDEEDAGKRERLLAYCRQDVVVERAVALRVRRLSDRERAVYLLDQRINDRGVQLDPALIDALQALVDRGLGEADAAVRAETGGAASAVTQVSAIREWVEEQGVECPDLRRQTVESLLEEKLPSPVREVLTARSEAARSSTAKLKAMTDAMGEDGRVRGMLLYHGASTGRWSGKLVQPQTCRAPR